MDKDALQSAIIEEVKLRLDEKILASGISAAALKEKLKSYTAEIIQRVCHYLHHEELPKELVNVLVSMTCDLMSEDGCFHEADGKMSGLSLGDASISFGALEAQEGRSIDNLVRAYKSDLHCYRRMAW